MKNEKWKNHVTRFNICSIAELENRTEIDCEKIGKKILGYFLQQRRNWTISLGKGNTIQPLGIDASQDYIAVIVDRFHVVIIIFARSDGQFVCRLTDCPGVKFVKVHQNTCIASNSSGRTIFIWFGFIFIQNAT
ncbi:unnamed protein product [Oikopleura dioica]|uniref:Uncharacterized protein n=1 Tax=Oikopleura dioica TaxID=34765 RepID=E4XG42_OIKDI|nr:unnamed protein product [Oikopleura dioica]